jgi:hypothetical protein
MDSIYLVGQPPDLLRFRDGAWEKVERSGPSREVDDDPQETAS